MHQTPAPSTEKMQSPFAGLCPVRSRKDYILCFFLSPTMKDAFAKPESIKSETTPIKQILKPTDLVDHDETCKSWAFLGCRIDRVRLSIPCSCQVYKYQTIGQWLMVQEAPPNENKLT